MAGTLRVEVDGVPEVLAALRRIGPDAVNELKDANQRISEALASRIRSAAIASSGQSALMAGTVKAQRGVKPQVIAGGSGRVGRNRKPAFKILFGAEFGAHSLKQFRAFNSTGYWFFRTADDSDGMMAREWQQAAEAIVIAWTVG